MSAIVTKTVRCAGELPAFLAVPETDRRGPAIVLMHERYGLVQHTRDLTERYARDGYVCIAPDFFHKHPDQAALHRGEVGYDISDPEAVAFLEAAIDHLIALPWVDASRIAVTGVCQTGRPSTGAGCAAADCGGDHLVRSCLGARVADQPALSQAARGDRRRGGMSGSRNLRRSRPHDLAQRRAPLARLSRSSRQELYD
jgi:dienelactone hydrolase